MGEKRALLQPAKILGAGDDLLPRLQVSLRQRRRHEIANRRLHERKIKPRERRLMTCRDIEMEPLRYSECSDLSSDPCDLRYR